MMADEAVDAEYQDAFHFSFNLVADPNRASAPAASLGTPSISNAQTARIPPPPQRTVIRPPPTSNTGTPGAVAESSMTRVAKILAGAPAIVVRAPGYGGATARTR